MYNSSYISSVYIGIPTAAADYIAVPYIIILLYKLVYLYSRIFSCLIKYKWI